MTTDAERELLEQICEKIAAKSSLISQGSRSALGIMLYDVRAIIQAEIAKDKEPA